MQVNIVNITDEEIDYLLAKIGVQRHNGMLWNKATSKFVGQEGVYVGRIEPRYLEIDFEKLKKLEAVKI